MKSPQVTDSSFIADKSAYSALQVLQSAAGWYVGTIYTDPETGDEEPGSRDTEYFKSRAAAEAALKLIEADSPDAPDLRLTP